MLKDLSEETVFFIVVVGALCIFSGFSLLGGEGSGMTALEAKALREEVRKLRVDVDALKRRTDDQPQSQGTVLK